MEYVVSVKGDITGDGISNINDVIRVSKCLTNKDEIVGMEYMNAADVTNDDKVNINDVIRLSKSLMSGNR